MSQESIEQSEAVNPSPYFDASGTPVSAAVEQRIQRLSTATGRTYDEELAHVREDPTRLEVSDSHRKELLQEEIQRLGWQGYQVVSQTDSTAELVKPKKFRVGLALVLLLFTFGIGLIVYLIYYLLKKNDHASISVDALGHVTATGVDAVVDPAYSTTS